MDNWLWPCLSKKLAQLLTPGLFSAGIIMDNWLWPCLSKELYSLVVNTWFVQCRDHHHGQLVVVLPRLSKELAQLLTPGLSSAMIIIKDNWLWYCLSRELAQLLTPGLSSAGIIIMDNWLWSCCACQRNQPSARIVIMDNWLWPCLSKELAQLLTPGLFSAGIVIMDNWLWSCLSKELYSLVVNTWFVQCRDRHHGQLVVALPVKAGTSLIVQPN